MTNKKLENDSAASPDFGQGSDSLPNVKAQRWTWLARLVRLCRGATAQEVTDMAIRCSALFGSVVCFPTSCYAKKRDEKYLRWFESLDWSWLPENRNAYKDELKVVRAYLEVIEFYKNNRETFFPGLIPQIQHAKRMSEPNWKEF